MRCRKCQPVPEEVRRAADLLEFLREADLGLERFELDLLDPLLHRGDLLL